MAREHYNPQEIGNNFENRRVRLRATTNGGKNDGASPKEGLLTSVEVRLVDWTRDAKPIADILNDSRVIEHEAGVAPRQTKKDIPKFRVNINDHITLTPGATMTPEGLKAFADDIIIATPDEVRAYFAKLSRVETYVAEVGGRVVGTASFEKPSPIQAGKRVGTIFKLAVDPDAPKVIESSRYGKGIGRHLVRMIDNRAKELSLTSVGASLIKGVEGYLSPMSLFVSEGYTVVGESPKDTLGWDNKEEKYVERDTIKLQLQLVIPQAS